MNNYQHQKQAFFFSILKHLGSINTKGVEKHNLKISWHL